MVVINNLLEKLLCLKISCRLTTTHSSELLKKNIIMLQGCYCPNVVRTD